MSRKPFLRLLWEERLCLPEEWVFKEPKLSEASKRVEARREAGGLEPTVEWDQVGSSRRCPNPMNPLDPHLERF